MKERSFFLAEKICAGYHGKEIIHQVSFSLEAHTLTGLLGANGCGKTTLLRSIANQISHSGVCHLEGECLEKQSARALAKKISYIPQKSGLSISLPVLDVVLMGFNPVLRLLEHPSKEQRELAKNALKQVGLEHYIHRDYLTLSEGQKQLVFLARTLIENTRLLLLDEPDSALDFQNRYHILQQLKELVEMREQAGILCLHDPTLALEFCKQLVLIKEGMCVGILHPKEDSLETMEQALREIYGSVSLVRCYDRLGKAHITLLWEDML